MEPNHCRPRLAIGIERAGQNELADVEFREAERLLESARGFEDAAQVLQRQANEMRAEAIQRQEAARDIYPRRSI